MAPLQSGWDGGTVGPGRVGGISHITGGKARQGLYDASATQNYPLGYRLAFEDGRVFRYAHFKGAVSQGKLAAADATYSVLTMNGCFCNKASVYSDVSAGVETVYLRNSNVTRTHSEDILAGGFLHITDESSEGYTYKIKSNKFHPDGGGVSVMRIDLYDPIKEAIDSEDSCAITACRFKNVAIYNAGTDDVLAGVTMADMSAGYYGWVQTWGEATVLLDGTATLGGIVTGSDGTDGAVQPMGGGVKNSEEQVTELIPEPVVGYFMQVVPTTEYCPIYLMLAP